MNSSTFRLAALLLCGVAATAQAGPLITEIYFNPPGSNDAGTTGLEYIELCGPQGMSLANHYLVFIENENDEFNSQFPGDVESVFNLNGMSFGSNGYMVLAMRNTPYPSLSIPFDILTPANPAAPTIAESLKTLPNGAHAYVNRDTGNGYGSDLTSSIGHSGTNADVEGSGFTAMLLSVDPLAGVAPFVGQDLDLGNNGLDVANGAPGWTVLDSIGVFGELGESDYGRLYSQVGFGPGGFAAGGIGGIEAGGTYVNTFNGLAEIEYIGRVDTTAGPESWMVANLTNDPASGYTNALRNYAVSGDHANQTAPEAYVGSSYAPAPFVYGTDVTVTFGADNVGFNGTHVPEPSSYVLLALGMLGVLGVTRRRRVVKA